MFSVQIGGHHQTSFGSGGADEFEHFFIAVQGLGGPVLGDLGEQPMFDGIPFGGASGVVIRAGTESRLSPVLQLAGRAAAPPVCRTGVLLVFWLRPWPR